MLKALSSSPAPGAQEKSLSATRLPSLDLLASSLHLWIPDQPWTGSVWAFVCIGVQQGLPTEDRLYSPVCAHFSPFLFPVFFLGFMRWSSVFWCFLSFCLFYVLFSGQFLDFILEFSGGNFVFQHLQFITKSTICLVSVSSRFIAPCSCFENAVCSRNILISLERFVAC